MKSLVLSKGKAATEPTVTTEGDYSDNPSVGLHYSPFNYAAVTYDILGNVQYHGMDPDAANPNQAHEKKMREIHRSEKPVNDLQKALDVIIKGEEAGDEEEVDEQQKEIDKEQGESEAVEKGGPGSGPKKKEGSAWDEGKSRGLKYSTYKKPKERDSFKEAQDMVRKERTNVLLEAFKSVDAALDNLIKAECGTKKHKKHHKDLERRVDDLEDSKKSAVETAFDVIFKAKDKKRRCWEGYEPVPGKKPYSEDSCRPVKKSDGLLSKAKASTTTFSSTGRGIHSNRFDKNKNKKNPMTTGGRMSVGKSLNALIKAGD